MKHLKWVLLLFLAFLNCISTMETARVKKGGTYNTNVQYTVLRPESSGWDVQEQDTKVFSVNVKGSRGYIFGDNGKYGLEIGLEGGLLSYPSVAAVTDFNENSGKYDFIYYPMSSDIRLTGKYSLKFGIRQDKKISYAAKVEMASDRFASAAIIASKKGLKKELYTGFKLFNRFLRNAEKKLIGSSYGQYFFIGMEKPTKQRFMNSYKFFHWYFEGGIINNLWYMDKPTVLLSVGLSIK